MTNISNADVITQFRDAMRAAGIATADQIIPDGKLHRCHVEGDHRSKRNGWYILYIDAHPAGVFGCNKRMGQESAKWSMKGIQRLSRDELRAMQAKAKADGERKAKEKARKFAAAAVEANTVWEAATPCDVHPYLARKAVASHGLRTTTWTKHLGHDPQTGEIRELAVNNALLIPIRNERREMVSLQAIFPATIEALGRDKDFIAGGEKRGCYFTIPPQADALTHDGKRVVCIAEGYATAATISQVTGAGCVVAFDAGNLKPVAEIIRRLLPNDVIIIAADNDAWSRGNPGLAAGVAAAEVCGGHVAVPAFADISTKPTDFNDLAALEGPGAVRTQIMAALAAPAPEPKAEPEPESEPAPAEPEPKTEADIKAEKKAERERKKAEKLAAAKAHQEMLAANPDFYNPEAYFTVLGHDRQKIFVYSHEMKLIVSHPITGWNKHTMIQIARPAFWQKFNPGSNTLEPPPWDICENWLIEQAYAKGFFNPRISRGRGAWLDEDRIVYHFGNMLTVDGAETPVTGIRSRFVYEQGHTIPPPSDEALTDEEGRKLFDVARMFRWEKSGSAVLLAGGVALAPVCGALKWRPHIWITGAAGSGKTTVLNQYCAVLMAGTALHSDGNSTEAGIRQQLRSDALPVLFDESEQADEKAEQRVQNIIALARQSSSASGAKTYKGTANGEGQTYDINSMFFLCSIGVTIKNDADRDRLTVLALKSRREGADPNNWPAIKNALYEISRDDDIPARLMRRSIDLLPITLQNIDIFAAAAAEKFGSQREGDQYGTLMAGAWSLVSSKLATLDQARAMIARYDWSDYVEHTETDDATKALSALLGAMIRTPRNGDITVYELVCKASNQDVESIQTIDMKDADSILRRHGMTVIFEDGLMSASLLVSNNSTEVPKLLEGTPYAGDVRGQLLRYRGASKHPKPVKFNGVVSRCIAISLADIAFGGHQAPQHEELDDVPF